MRGIKIPQQDVALKMPGGAYLRDTTVLLTEMCLQQCPCMEGRVRPQSE